MDQLDKDRQYLNHVLRNSTARIAGCLKEIEITLREMNEVMKQFRADNPVGAGLAPAQEREINHEPDR
jgi:GTP1/Obg family GTP-binding protein